MTDEFEAVEGDAVGISNATTNEQLIIESLDIGVLLVEPSAKIACSNHLARQALAAFGTDTAHVPAGLWTVLRSSIDAARAVPSRFTPAAPVSSPDRRKYFVRCRRVSDAGIVITIAPSTLREIDVQRVLAEQFGLSAQEIRIAFFAAQGYRNREIAERLDVVEGTVKNYLTSVFSALSVRSRTELANELAHLVEDQTDVHRRR